MKSGVFLDSQGGYDGRDRHDVLTDFKLHEWIVDDPYRDEVAGREGLEQKLSDDEIYLIERDYYHTPQNVDPHKAHKVGAGADNQGRAGDIDVGRIDLETGKITRLELKSPGRIPPVEKRAQQEEMYDLVEHGVGQNEYMRELLDNIERNQGVDIPYSSRVLAWNDVVEEPIEDIHSIPNYSDVGAYLCTPEAERKARESDIVSTVDNDLFRGWLFGGDDSILENIDQALEEN
ncbi:MAG: hypothetical protein ACI9LV_000892 [Candidatus Nanohaloarchaea archaeon]